MKESTRPVHELEPEPADLPTSDRPRLRLFQANKPQEEPAKPAGDGYWETIHDQRVWIRLCPPASALAPLTLRERFGSKGPANRHEQRTRLDGDSPHHGGHSMPVDYSEGAGSELEEEVSQTRGSWASGWAAPPKEPEADE